METPSFINGPSRKFYEFFKEKISKKVLDNKTLAEKFNKYESNPAQLLSGLANGKYSVTVEMILLAQVHFGLNPSSLFEDVTEPVHTESFIVNDDGVSHQMINVSVGAMAESVLKQQAILEVLLADKVEEVAKETRNPVSKVSAEFELQVNKRLRAIQSGLKTGRKL